MAAAGTASDVPSKYRQGGYQSRRLEDSSGKDLSPEGVTPVEELLVGRRIPERDFFQLLGLRLHLAAGSEYILT